MTQKALNKKRMRWDLFFLILPLMALVIAFCYVPLAGWYFAFIEYRVGTPILQCEFVGFDNFVRLFGTTAFTRAFKNTLIYSTAKYVMLVCPAVFAILFNEIRNVRFRKVVQTMSTLPYFISWVIVYSLAYALFSSEGPVNRLLAVFGTSQNLLINRDVVYLFQSLLYLWKMLGWNSIIYVAAIAGIDPQLYEAAAIDGAGRLRQFWHISLSGIKSTIVVMLILRIGSMMAGNFDQVQSLLNDQVLSVGDVLDTFVYRVGVSNSRFSFASAAGLFNSAVGAVLLLASDRLAKRLGERGLF